MVLLMQVSIFFFTFLLDQLRYSWLLFTINLYKHGFMDYVRVFIFIDMNKKMGKYIYIYLDIV